MEYLYAPWRSGYFTEKNAECVFCAVSKGVQSSSDIESLKPNTTGDSTSSPNLPQADLANRVFYRDDKVFCVMNKFPYTPGHFLIIPHLHTHSPELLEMEIWLHLQKIAHKSVALLKEFGAQGINLGMNIERAGGAGIPEHLHLHLIPRFIGDTNFFTTIGDSRAYGVDFDAIFQHICKLAQVYLKES